MNQLQGDSVPTSLADTDAMVHLALWSPLLRKTRCGVVLEDDARRVDKPVDCMTCLTRAEVFEVPLQSDRASVNHYNENCWLKQVHGARCGYGYITECCFTEDPCDYHKQ